MTFLHKLAQRLARLKAALLMGVVATIACEVPVANLSSAVSRLHLSPKTSTLRAGQTTQFTVVALTPTGDTANVGVRWAITGGSIVDTSTSGGKHYLQYRAPNEPGQYKVATLSMAAGMSDSAVVTVSTVSVASMSVSPSVTSLLALQTVQLTALVVDSVGGALTDRVVTWASNNAAIATVNGNGLVTGVAAGTATVTATSEGKNATATVTVEAAPVASVSVSPAAVSLTIAQTVQLMATPKDANGIALPGRVVTWGSEDPGVATVSGSGLVTSVGAGTTVITATSEGRSVTAAITVTPTQAPVAWVGVSPASANLSTGQAVQLTATPVDASGNALVGRVVTWSSGNTNVATVNGNGLVTGVAAGSVTITAVSEGQDGSSAITVTAPVATVGVSPTPSSVTVGQTVQLAATPRDAGGNALTGRVVTWGSSSTNVATVNGNGLVTGVAAGLVTITATSEGRSGTAAVSVTPTPVASVTLSPAAPSIGAGQTVQLTATPRSATGALLTGRVVTWTSDNTGIATVAGNGLVTGVAAGSVTITAMSEGQDGSSAITVTPTLAPVAWVGVSPASANLSTGQTVQLTGTPWDAGGNALTDRVVTWSSSSTNVATVNGNGLVTGVAAGSVTITATSESGSGTAAVSVTPPPPTPPTPVASVTVSPTAPSVGAGQTVQLTATPWDASGNALTGRVVTWSSSSTNVATVNGNGLVTGVAAGSVTITATSEGESGSSAITVTAAAPPPPTPVASVNVSPTAPSVGAGQTVQLTATPRSASGALLTGRVVTWTSGNTGIATVASNGLVTGVTAGTATITATSEGIGGNASVTVTAAPPPPPPPTGGTWPNEPAGYTTITDYAFNDAVPRAGDTPVGSGWSATNPNGRVSRVTDGTAPQSASNVMEWYFPAGFTGGNYPGEFYYPASGTKGHYVGYWFKYSNPFDMGPGNKQWYPYSTNANFFMSVTSSWKIKMEVQAGAGYGGTYNLLGNVSDPTITRDVWHRMEILQVYPSTSSTNNGVFKWWIDGVLCGNYTNVGWNTSASYQELRLSPVWGSFSSDVVAYSGQWWVDHIHVSKP